MVNGAHYGFERAPVFCHPYNCFMRVAPLLSYIALLNMLIFSFIVFTVNWLRNFQLLAFILQLKWTVKLSLTMVRTIKTEIGRCRVDP